MRKLTFLSLFTMIIYGCNKHVLPGKYVCRYNGAVSELYLGSNYHFRYLMDAHLMLQKSYGKWSKHNSYILLTSDSTVTQKNGRTEEKSALGYSSQLVEVFFDDEKTKFPKINVILNDSISMITDSLGRLVTDFPIKSILINEPEFGTQYHYYVRTDGPVRLKIILTPNNNVEVFFSNIRYEISKRGLISNSGRVFSKYY